VWCCLRPLPNPLTGGSWDITVSRYISWAYVRSLHYGWASAGCAVQVLGTGQTRPGALVLGPISSRHNYFEKLKREKNLCAHLINPISLLYQIFDPL
jgi:hypothetical protein